jgi:hypothetical protein
MHNMNELEIDLSDGLNNVFRALKGPGDISHTSFDEPDTRNP